MLKKRKNLILNTPQWAYSLTKTWCRLKEEAMSQILILQWQVTHSQRWQQHRCKLRNCNLPKFRWPQSRGWKQRNRLKSKDEKKSLDRLHMEQSRTMHRLNSQNSQTPMIRWPLTTGLSLMLVNYLIKRISSCQLRDKINIREPVTLRL